MRNICCLFGFVFVFFFFACTRESKSDVYNEVKHMIGRQVFFPSNIKILTYDGKTKDYLFRDGYKILFVADSTNCVPCKLKLDKWFFEIKKIDSISSSNVEFCLVMRRTKQKDILPYLRSVNFSYPIMLDMADSICKKNHFFSNNDYYNCFLLDRKNNIILVGNPTYSSNIEDLYI